MADDADQLVISISADTSQIDRAINRLLGTVNSSTRGIETSFTRAGVAMDGVGVSATKLQQQINALAGVSAFKDRSADIAAYGAGLDDLRAKYNPLFALSKQYEKELDGINGAAKVGAITSAEQASAVDDLNDRYTKGQSATGKLADAHAGLSAQAMAAQHSVRSVVEQLALGIPPTQALTGQLNHLSFAASGPGGLTKAFKDAAAPLGGLLSAGTATFVGIAAVVGGAAFALNGYLDAQQKVQTASLGAGRASGATAGSINSAASQGASTFGLSVSEARDLATALAETGKVANDSILPIVNMGHDIAIAFGTDAKGAADILAKAFSDPVRGADQLNQRLGFLDAATKQNISNLVAQNNSYGAQKVLIDATKASLDGFSAAESATAKGWTAVGNAASNAWGSIGRFFANAIGAGQSLEERLDAAKRKLDDLKQPSNTVNYFTGTVDVGGSADEIAKQQKVVDDLTAAIQRNAVASINALAAQKSFAQQSAVRDLTPEIAQQEALNNQLKVLQGLFDQLSNSESAGETLKQLGLTFEQITSAINKAKTAISDFKTDYERQIQSQQISLQSVTAFSPSAKGDVAYQQAYNDALRTYNDETKAATIASNARATAIKQVTTGLSEQARAQILTSTQAVTSAQLDVTLVGKSIGQQAELAANLTARQQLEQVASQNRTAFNQSEYDQLTKINARLGEQRQLAAQVSAQDSANFTLQTVFLSDIDQQIASVQKQLHGNAWPQYMNDGLAATMRITDSLKILHDVGQDVTRGVFTDFETQIRNGASAMDALRTAGVNALGKIADKLASIAADQLWASAFGGSSGGGLLSLLGLGGSSAQEASASTLANNTGGSFFGPGFDIGGYTGPGGRNQPAGIVHKGEVVFSQRDVARAGGVGMVESMRLRGYADGGIVAPSLPSVSRGIASAGSSPSFTFAPQIDARGADVAAVARIEQVLARQQAEFASNVVATVKKAKSSRML